MSHLGYVSNTFWTVILNFLSVGFLPFMPGSLYGGICIFEIECFYTFKLGVRLMFLSYHSSGAR